MPSSCDSRASSAASLVPSSASCRVTRSSALMATRSLNALCPLICGASSFRKKSATALISSDGVGSSCTCPSPRRQQPQQIDFGLRRPPADHRTLQRMVGTETETLHHAAAHDAPAQRAHHSPKMPPRRLGAPAGRLIAGEQLLARAKTADRLVDLAEPPRVDADPAEILH